jgi:Lrp/AsnC family leucine-responsive transcriptional regulator
MLDDIDLQILSIIQKDARVSNAEIAQQVGMATSAIFERIKKLEKRAVIQGYETRVSAKALDLGLTAFIFVKAQEKLGSGEAGQRLALFPEVQEIHLVAGEDCYLVKVRVANTDALATLLRERISTIETIESTKTTIVLTTLKETAQLPMEFKGKDKDV